MTPQQRRYEAKKALLKRIKEQWRLQVVTPETWGQSLDGYLAAREKLSRYIRNSIAHKGRP